LFSHGAQQLISSSSCDGLKHNATRHTKVTLTIRCTCRCNMQLNSFVGTRAYIMAARPRMFCRLHSKWKMSYATVLRIVNAFCQQTGYSSRAYAVSKLWPTFAEPKDAQIQCMSEDAYPHNACRQPRANKGGGGAGVEVSTHRAHSVICLADNIAG